MIGVIAQNTETAEDLFEQNRFRDFMAHRQRTEADDAVTPFQERIFETISSAYIKLQRHSIT